MQILWQENARDKQQCPAYDQVDSDTSTEIIDNVIVVNAVQPGDEIYAQMFINNKPVVFQVDSGASVNIVPSKHLRGADHIIAPSKKKLMMWNRITMNIEGVCRVKLFNPKTDQKYSIK